MGASHRGPIDDLGRPPLTARINDGDRTIFREDAGAGLFVDVVSHDDIGKYGRKVPGA